MPAADPLFWLRIFASPADGCDPVVAKVHFFRRRAVRCVLSIDILV